MDETLETAALGGLAAEAAATSAPSAAPSHTHGVCLNCGARLQGRYCQDCGQGADDHHRSIGHLLWEAVEGFTHLDGRLAQTLPALLFRPGRLARDHIEGRRQRHVPPFRLFLITLPAFMFAAEFAVGQGGRHVVAVAASPHARSAYQAGLKQALASSDLAEARAEVEKQVSQDSVSRWLSEHIGRATSNREYFLMLVFEWRTAYDSHRIGAAAKALTLWFATVTAFGALLASLLAYALNEV